MKFYALYETAKASGQYVLGSALIDADSTTAALAIAVASAPAGCRTGVWPFRQVSGTPDAVAPTADETGKQYDVLVQAGGASDVFKPDGQVFASVAADAAGMCLSLERFFGYRLGLIPQNAQPAAEPAATPASTDTPAGTSDAADQKTS
ncbi:hypothetical protein APT_02063 [Acetobacter pasteurianus NBRC 101655]|uniref:hypothetical protein n=1 Tax=Acetobacter pasteurianus TaxID=438 RepID=UPI00024576DD|nr:hypothetical protein [Acetobacter pasteurianus]BAU39145.1 hypothetical protein APT_02063 [Acetobacter pasteurianus NBRC 101655]